MNYRHHFHAGNFADVHKHAILLQVLARLTAGREPLTVIDTHAGAGAYDLAGDLARRSREADVGIGRLVSDTAAPAGFAPLKAAVAALNKAEPPRLYPGSPWLAAHTLRPGDRYIGCELRPDDHQALLQCLEDASVRGGPALETVWGDGFAVAERWFGAPRGRTLLMIDPPYESGDDYGRIVRVVRSASRAGSAVSVLIWAPIKDLETLDGLLRSLETLPFAEGWAAEVRLRSLRDPMRLNGSALVGLGLPAPPNAEAICVWSAAAAGETGALGRVTPLFV